MIASFLKFRAVSSLFRSDIKRLSPELVCRLMLEEECFVWVRTSDFIKTQTVPRLQGQYLRYYSKNLRLRLRFESSAGLVSATWL